MSVKKKDLVYNVGNIVKINYMPKMEGIRPLSDKQKKRQGRMALIVGLISKPEYKSFSNDFIELYRYEIIVGKEKIQIDQTCLENL